jgi:hypothetical protein
MGGEAMTESEWLECTDPKLMLALRRGKASDRRLRLFAVACCRRIWRLIEDETCRSAVEVAERYADGQATETERATTEGELNPASSAVEAATYSTIAVEGRAAEGASHAVRAACAAAHEGSEWGNAEDAPPEEHHIQVAFLHDIFGNPFRPVSINPSWLTPAVLGLARSAYDERAMPSGELDPARLGVLSDALEETGCDNGDILDHLRGPGPHVRGCWAVDLLLGKE